MVKHANLSFGTGSSIVVKKCQICSSSSLKQIISLGYMPPVNSMPPIGTQPQEQPSYPAQLLYCPKCHLVQIGLIVDPKILFPYEYPYTSGTTKVLRENFADLSVEATKLINLKLDELVIDIGSNDGTLLSNFKDKCKVLGITPEEIGKLAISQGIPTVIEYFTSDVTKKVIKEYGKAKIVTAANVFAHIEDIHSVVKNVISLLNNDGVFISESHYLFPLIQTNQYDTIYHEHLRYYSLHALQYLFSMHDLEIFHVKEIPSHGGSIRVYAAKKGKYKIDDTVRSQLKKEKSTVANEKSLKLFHDKVVESKLALISLIAKIKKNGAKIYGISAPSRGTTLINYTGIDEDILDCVVEVKGSHKVGKYIPGTLIPVLDEDILFKTQPEYALLLSWHIANELIPKLKNKGYKGKFIVPLPFPKVYK